MKEQIIKLVDDFIKSSELIKKTDSKKEIRIFNDKRVFEIFSNSEKEITLTPFNDYTYDVLYNFLYSLNEWLKENDIEELDDLNMFLDEEYINYDEFIYNYSFIEYLEQYYIEIEECMKENKEVSLSDAINMHYQELQQNLFYEYLENIISYFNNN
jgi:hypothetical protein